MKANSNPQKAKAKVAKGGAAKAAGEAKKQCIWCKCNRCSGQFKLRSWITSPHTPNQVGDGARPRSGNIAECSRGEGAP